MRYGVALDPDKTLLCPVKTTAEPLGWQFWFFVSGLHLLFLGTVDTADLVRK